MPMYRPPAFDFAYPARMHEASHRLAAAIGVLALALGACGEGDPKPAAAPVPEAPAPEADKPERQVISAELDAKVAGRELPPRDTPLAVGTTGPDLQEMRDGAPAIVVFYRGHW